MALSDHPPVDQQGEVFVCAGQGLLVLKVCDAFSHYFNGQFSFEIISGGRQ